MSNYKIVEEYDGRLPIFNVIKEIESKHQILETFDSYEDAEKFLVNLLDSNSTPCGEEDPCN